MPCRECSALHGANPNSKRNPINRIYQDLLGTKLDPYSLNRETETCNYLCLKNRKQAVRKNGTQSKLGDIISVAPQG